MSLALGSADVTPLELATGYAVFANGGYKIEPYWLERVTDREGEELFKAQPLTVCEGCIYAPELMADEVVEGRTETGDEVEELPRQEDEALTSLPLAPRIIDEQTAYLINNIMQDVIKRGTGRKAAKLGRNDLAGKTGTTNDLKDAWFSGFNRNLVASVWVGLDQPQTLGRSEFGSTAALPIWIDYMEQALQGEPEAPLIPPQGIVSVRIDPGNRSAGLPRPEKCDLRGLPQGGCAHSRCGAPRCQHRPGQLGRAVLIGAAGRWRTA